MGVLGKTGRQRWRHMLAAMAGVVIAVASVVVFTGGGSGAVTGSPSNFESNDGNMVLNTPGNTDWNCFVNSGNFAHNGSTPAGCHNTSGATQITADASGEVEWVSGQKFDTQCPGLNTGNNPPKDEFTNVASFNDTAANHDVFFYGATIRSTANGNASGDVEFNQSSGNGTTSAGCRTAGDRLLAYDYLNGGTNLDFHVLTWIDSTNSTAGGNNGTCFVKTDTMPCWGANVVTVSPSNFDGLSNQSAINAADNGLNNTALAVNQFAEFGVNLTQALGLGGQCISFPQQVWESRSSGSSFTSNPQDIEIEQHAIQTCGEIKIIKQTDPRGQNQSFSFSSGSQALPQSSTAGGVACPGSTTAGVQPDGSFCLNDTGNTGKTLGSTDPAQNSTGNTVDETNVPQGTYTVTEGAAPGSFSFEGLSCSTDPSSGSSASTSSQTATINLQPGGVVTCLYENKLHSGAILLTKTGKDKSCLSSATAINNGVCTGNATADLAGATFKVTTDAAGNSPVAGSPITTNSTGTACIDGLDWASGGTPYYVTETAAPSGYAIDNSSAVSVTVNQNAKCSDSNIASEAATQSISDTPLTNLTVNAAAQIQGATNSTVTCTNASSANIGNSPAGPSDPANVTANGLTPGTYSCTVVIDP